MNIEGMKRLCNAIVLRAVEDYRSARNRIRKNKKDMKAEWQIQEIQNFFLSSWFTALTSLDGKTLIRKLEEEGSAS